MPSYYKIYAVLFTVYLPAGIDKGPPVGRHSSWKVAKVEKSNWPGEIRYC
jgi:hypothetical protein